MREVQLELHDPNCGGVTSSDGRIRYDANKRGVVTVPAHEATNILQTPLASRYRTGITTGFSIGNLQHEYETYCEANPDRYVSYATWYRENKEAK